MLKEELLPSGSRVTQLVICQNLFLSPKPSCTWLFQSLTAMRSSVQTLGDHLIGVS